MKYKLLKDLPEVKAGEIFEPHKSLRNYFAAESSNLSYLKEFIDNNPDWFTPYKFTTDDGVDIFKDDYSYYWNGVDKHFKDEGWCFGWSGDDETGKYFSTKEAAQKYIDSLKTQFEKYKWYNRNGCDSMYIGDGKGVGFVGGSDRWRDDFEMTDRSLWTKSDLKEVEKLLIHKAKEDYPEGTKFKTAELFVGNTEGVVSEIKRSFVDEKIMLYDNRATIYYNGKWANIIEKPIIKTDDGKFWYPSDFVEGKVIHVSYNDRYYPNNWIIECNGNEGRIIRSAASVSSKSFYMNSEGVWGDLKSDYKIREATPEEKEFLQKCKYANKFVKDDELVMVTDWEHCYSCFKSKAKELSLKNWEYGDNPENNKVYRVVKEFYDKEECTAIQDLTTKQTFIMSNQGLQLIKKV